MKKETSPFDTLAARYDAWYDSADGRPLFEAEVACVRMVMPRRAEGWLEVGVGTGRFARALGVRDGVDLSKPMLGLAAVRGVQVARGDAEALPYRDVSFDGAIMVATFCFLDAPLPALRECARVLRDGASLVVGIVPADSDWGRFYAAKARDGHAFYSAAKFYTCEETSRLAASAGFRFDAAASTLFGPPDGPLRRVPIARHGHAPGAGFAALRFVKSGTGA